MYPLPKSSDQKKTTIDYSVKLGSSPTIYMHMYDVAH